MSRLVSDLLRDGYLRTSVIIDAFSEIHRIEFVPKEFETSADANIPLPIGFGQTISQPATVAIMLELLDPEPGQNILDVGSGSGWTASLLSYIVGSKGKVTSVERIKELIEFAKDNTDKFGYVKNGIAEFYCNDGFNGYPGNAPYDRILVSAMTEDIPAAFKEQLRVGGKMVIPIHNDIWYVEKRSETEYYKEEYPGFSFVPLIEGLSKF